MIQFILISVMCLISSCTFNVSMAYTQGAADDVIDDTASATPDISPVVTFPLMTGTSVGVPR